MEQLFRLKIGAKRQITVPQQLLTALNLAESDEIQVVVKNGEILTMQPYKSVPLSLLPKEVLAKIKEREKQLAQGKGTDVQDALEKIPTPA